MISLCLKYPPTYGGKDAERSYNEERGTWRGGEYPSLSAGSLIGNRDESSIVKQPFVCSTLWFLLLFLFFDFGGLGLDFAGTGKGPVLFTLKRMLG